LSPFSGVPNRTGRYRAPGLGALAEDFAARAVVLAADDRREEALKHFRASVRCIGWSLQAPSAQSLYDSARIKIRLDRGILYAALLNPQDKAFAAELLDLLVWPEIEYEQVIRGSLLDGIETASSLNRDDYYSPVVPEGREARQRIFEEVRDLMVATEKLLDLGPPDLESLHREYEALCNNLSPGSRMAFLRGPSIIPFEFDKLGKEHVALHRMAVRMLMGDKVEPGFNLTKTSEKYDVVPEKAPATVLYSFGRNGKDDRGTGDDQRVILTLSPGALRALPPRQ
jgi:hypothetical protein